MLTPHFSYAARIVRAACFFFYTTFNSFFPNFPLSQCSFLRCLHLISHTRGASFALLYFFCYATFNSFFTDFPSNLCLFLGRLHLIFSARSPRVHSQLCILYATFKS